MKADHNIITPFGVKVMSKYNVLSKRERCMIKNKSNMVVLLQFLSSVQHVEDFIKLKMRCRFGK